MATPDYRPLPTAGIFDDAFHGIERDGAGLVEVGVRLQRCYGRTAEHGSADFADDARNRARAALDRAANSGLTATERNRLAAHDRLTGMRDDATTANG